MTADSKDQELVADQDVVVERLAELARREGWHLRVDKISFQPGHAGVALFLGRAADGDATVPCTRTLPAHPAVAAPSVPPGQTPLEQRVAGGGNFGTLLPDEITGIPYLTDLESGHRLYKYGPCRICGISHWGWSRQPRPDCLACKAPEANDNDEPAGTAAPADRN